MKHYRDDPDGQIAKETIRIDSRHKDEIDNLFDPLEDFRLNCTYVGLMDKSENIVIPSQQVNVESCERLISMIEKILPHIERMLKFDKKTFSESGKLIASLG